MWLRWKQQQRTLPPEAGLARERRRHLRYPAVVDLAHVRWQDDDGTANEPACLVDISRGGARLLADIPLPGGAALRITLSETGELPEVEASIVRVSECRGVGYLVQVKFLQPCPDDVFERAIGGPEGPGLALAETPETGDG